VEVGAGQRVRRSAVPGRAEEAGAGVGPRLDQAVGLAGFEDRFPHQLSGGMRKRVALAQNLITEPQVILMDEPFSALDVQTRAKMSDELLALWDLTRPAVVFVTHDLEEAIALADTVVVLTAGPAATIKARFPVDLPRPRVVQEIRFDQRFLDIYHQVWEALRSEVDIAYSQSTRLDAEGRAS
jgi:NitT/TauT family transport system ATP-binding protein